MTWLHYKHESNRKALQHCTTEGRRRKVLINIIRLVIQLRPVYPNTSPDLLTNYKAGMLNRMRHCVPDIGGYIDV